MIIHVYQQSIGCQNHTSEHLTILLDLKKSSPFRCDPGSVWRVPQKVNDFLVEVYLFLPHFKTNPETSHCQVYIYPIISSWCSITSPIFTSLKHHFPLNPYEISMKSHGKSIMAWTQEHLSHRRQNEHHPKRLRRLILWTSLNKKNSINIIKRH